MLDTYVLVYSSIFLFYVLAVVFTKWFLKLTLKATAEMSTAMLAQFEEEMEDDDFDKHVKSTPDMQV